jgi:hypothetical protein
MTRKRGLSLVVYSVLAASLEAPSTLGSFLGMVHRPFGRPVSMGVITITSVATGAIRSFLTDAREITELATRNQGGTKS